MALPTHNEPLRLADGRLVYPNGDIVAPAPVAIAEPERILPARVRRKANDLPAPAQQMNAIAVVLCYALYGLDDEEIAVATKLNAEQVGRIRDCDPYTQMHDAIMRTAMDRESDVVRDVFTKNARRAAATMVDALDAGARADRMAAARDILDRSGHRPADVVEHRHRMDGGLVIEIVRRDEHAQIPTIDVEAE